MSKKPGKPKKDVAGRYDRTREKTITKEDKRVGWEIVTCITCHGSGIRGSRTCGLCGGSGSIKVLK